jgi:hypothetical protein
MRVPPSPPLPSPRPAPPRHARAMAGARGPRAQRLFKGRSGRGGRHRVCFFGASALLLKGSIRPSVCLYGPQRAPALTWRRRRARRPRWNHARFGACVLCRCLQPPPAPAACRASSPAESGSPSLAALTSCRAAFPVARSCWGHRQWRTGRWSKDDDGRSSTAAALARLRASAAASRVPDCLLLMWCHAPCVSGRLAFCITPLSL